MADRGDSAVALPDRPGDAGQKTSGDVAGVERPRRGPTLEVIISRYGLIFAFLLTILVFSLARPHSFPTWRNTESILTLAAPSLILAVGLTVVLVMQDFDLSI